MVRTISKISSLYASPAILESTPKPLNMTYHRVSSSISNFKERIEKKYGYLPWRIFPKKGGRTIFFGMYHIGDYLRYIFTFGNKTVFWMGSDILKLTPLKAWLVRNAEHRCENNVEDEALLQFGIDAIVQPVFFGDPTKFRPEFRQDGSKKVHAYLSAHKGREEEYGVFKVIAKAKDLPSVVFHIYGIEDNCDCNKPKNVIFHGKVSEEQFNKEIQNYHIALRFNEFDGFSDILAKSALLGQYQYSAIKYPHMFSGKQWGRCLRHVVKAKKNNKQAWEFWHHTLSQ